MDQAENLRNVIKANEVTETQDPNRKEKQEPNRPGSKQTRVITVTSGKGGVGKSSLTVNLALQFSKQGKRVIIFDADFGMANIEVMFGAIPKYNLSDLIFKGMDLKDIIVKGPMDIGLISGGSGITSLNNMDKEQILYLVSKLNDLEELADIIIVDTGAGASDSVMEFVAASEEVLLVTTPEPTSITDSYALLKTLGKMERSDRDNVTINIIVNRVSDYEESLNLFKKLKVVVDKFLGIELKFLGHIPMDNNMSKAVMQQKPITILYPNTQGSKAIEKLANNLLAKTYNAYSKDKGLARVFQSLFKSRTKNRD